MKGTSDEILVWLTHHSEYAPLLQMSRQRLVGLRHHIQQGSISERRKEEILDRLQKRMEALQSSSESTTFHEHRCIRKVRDKYILPAIVRNHHGMFYSEIGFIKMVAREERMRDLNLYAVCRALKRGDFPSKEIVREALRRKDWTMFEERMVLPSVWEVD